MFSLLTYWLSLHKSVPGAPITTNQILNDSLCNGDYSVYKNHVTIIRHVKMATLENDQRE